MDAPDPHRRFPRRAYSQPVLVEQMEGPGGAFALTRDVGLGGFAFVSPEPMEVEQPVRATLSVTRDVVVGEGRVVWAGPTADGRYRVGVEITRMDPFYRALYRAIAEAG